MEHSLQSLQFIEAFDIGFVIVVMFTVITVTLMRHCMFSLVTVDL